MEEVKIYVAVAATVQVPPRHIIQPPGRQIAQACHVVSKLRHGALKLEFDHRGHTFEISLFKPITTIILQVRDSAELWHVRNLLFRKKLNPIMFADTNPEYGAGECPTAVAVFAAKKQITGILDYLPLWPWKY